MKDFEFKLGTKEEAYWSEIKDRTQKELETLEKMLKFNTAILEMCESKLKEEMKGGKK